MPYAKREVILRFEFVKKQTAWRRLRLGGIAMKNAGEAGRWKFLLRRGGLYIVVTCVHPSYGTDAGYRCHTGLESVARDHQST